MTPIETLIDKIFNDLVYDLDSLNTLLENKCWLRLSELLVGMKVRQDILIDLLDMNQLTDIQALELVNIATHITAGLKTVNKRINEFGLLGAV